LTGPDIETSIIAQRGVREQQGPAAARRFHQGPDFLISSVTKTELEPDEIAASSIARTNSRSYRVPYGWADAAGQASNPTREKAGGAERCESASGPEREHRLWQVV